MDVNFAANTVQHYVDGAPVGGPLAFAAAFGSDVQQRRALVAYSRIPRDGRQDHIYRLGQLLHHRRRGVGAVGDGIDSPGCPVLARRTAPLAPCRASDAWFETNTRSGTVANGSLVVPTVFAPCGA
jgi:hypothetical protein